MTTPDPGPDADGYLLDNRQSEAGRRFEALSALFDPSTFRHIDGLGIAAGWRCWEVGAGGGTVPAWLAARVGPDGYVLATDIDPSWMATTERPPFEVRRHDAGTDAPPGDDFDLVHARLLLVHVPQRDAALVALVAALKPGGWLFVEDADPALQPLACLDEYGDEQRLANRLRLGFRELLAQRGADLAYGRTLPACSARRGWSRCTRTHTSRSPRRRATSWSGRRSNRFVTGWWPRGSPATAEIDEHLSNVASGRLDLATSPMISAWGRKPPGGPAQPG